MVATARDGVGNTSTKSFTVTVQYPFAGFFQPVDNLPVVNRANSGQALTTTQLFPSTTLARGASKSGTYTATETGTLTFKTAGTGDADLYVKAGSGASRTVFDCKSESSSSVEQCALSVTAGSVVPYSVYAYAASTVSLTVTSEAAAPRPPNRVDDSPVPSTAIGKGTEQDRHIHRTCCRRLVFRSRGTGDVDLYLKRGTLVTTTSNECSRKDLPL